MGPGGSVLSHPHMGGQTRGGCSVHSHIAMGIAQRAIWRICMSTRVDIAYNGQPDDFMAECAATPVCQKRAAALLRVHRKGWVFRATIPR